MNKSLSIFGGKAIERINITFERKEVWAKCAEQAYILDLCVHVFIEKCDFQVFANTILM